jgi:four helix bundle protein
MQERNERVFDLEERTCDFAVATISITERLPSSPAGRYYADQLLRSGGSPALHYGEAQGGESRKDFVHKMRIALKELRESRACMKIIQKANLHPEPDVIDLALAECGELIAIFSASILTAERNMGKNWAPKQ